MAAPVPDFQKIIDGMTLDQKIGQMYMGNFCGGESVDFARQNFEKYHLGNLQFTSVFERFIRGGDYMACGVSPNAPLDEVAKLVYDVKQAGEEITGLPILVAGDMEGGISGSIFRRRNSSLMPNNMGLGACGDLENAYWAAKIVARECKVMGMDMLYGPCLDVTRTESREIGVRSFSSDPKVCGEMAKAFIKAYDEEDVISNVKHFPGRGYGLGDAHHELESIDLSREDMWKMALYPFQKAIEAGVDSFMVAHTLYPAFEKEYLPASLSPRILTDLLRKEMGFDGMIIPDDLSMFAISKNFGLPEATAMCLAAGADMVFMKVPTVYGPAHEMIKKYVSEGKITEDNMNASLLRILKLKYKRKLFEKKPFSAEKVLSTVGCPEHKAVAVSAAQKAICVVRNRDNALPLKPEKAGRIMVVVPRDMTVVLANDENRSHDLFPNSLKRHYSDVQYVLVDENPNDQQIYEALGRAKNVDTIIFGVYHEGATPTLVQLMNHIVELSKPTYAVVTHSPYQATKLPKQISGIVCTMGISPFAFDAAADVIAGKAKATGKVPMDITIP